MLNTSKGDRAPLIELLSKEASASVAIDTSGQHCLEYEDNTAVLK